MDREHHEEVQNENVEKDAEKTKEQIDSEKTLTDKRNTFASSSTAPQPIAAQPLKFYIRTKQRTIWRVDEPEVTSNINQKLEETNVVPEGLITPEKGTGEEGEKTEELNLESSEHGSEKTVILPEFTPFNLNEVAAVETTPIDGQDTETPEKDPLNAEKAVSEKQKGIASNSAPKSAPASPQVELPPALSISPIIQTPLPYLFSENIPPFPPFSPFSAPHFSPIIPPITSTIPQPSPAPTLSKVTSHNLDTLLNVIDLQVPSPLKIGNTLTSSNINQFLNLN